MIEEASRYNKGMCRAEAASTAASTYQLAPGKPNTSTGLNRPALFVKNDTFQRVPPQRPAQAGRPPEVKPPQASGSSAKPNYPPKQQTLLRPQNSSACFECGQPGHIRANCPKLKQGLRTAAARQDDNEDPELDPANDPDLLIEGEGDPQNEDQNKELVADEWEPEEAQYQFDDEEDVTDDNTVTYRTSAIRVAPDDVATTKVMAVRSKTAAPNSAAEPMYHHRSKHRKRPDWLRHENRTLSGYWEINGVKAHCLLDSGSEGVLLSPEFTCATGMKMFALEQPIALQLACIGSRSTINYGTNTTIRFGRKIYDEYFDVANVEYYDAILGTVFLRKLGITLDFTSPGAVKIGS
jgi:Zinc knuckle